MPIMYEMYKIPPQNSCVLVSEPVFTDSKKLCCSLFIMYIFLAICPV